MKLIVLIAYFASLLGRGIVVFSHFGCHPFEYESFR
jgi:hypothetical protein